VGHTSPPIGSPSSTPYVNHPLDSQCTVPDIVGVAPRTEHGPGQIGYSRIGISIHGYKVETHPDSSAGRLCFWMEEIPLDGPCNMSIPDVFHTRHNIQPEPGRSQLVDTAWHQACATAEITQQQVLRSLQIFIRPIQKLRSRDSFVAPLINPHPANIVPSWLFRAGGEGK